MLNKYNITFILLLGCTLLISLDYGINGYAAMFSIPEQTARPSPLAASIISPSINPSLPHPVEVVSAEFWPEEKLSQFQISSPVLTSHFFTLLDVKNLNLDVLRYNISQDQKTVLRLYEITNTKLSAHEKYLTLKAALHNLAQTQDQIVLNETNQYGQFSFFINDSHRENIAFLIVQFSSHLLAFEYPKQNHNFIKTLIQAIEK